MYFVRIANGNGNRNRVFILFAHPAFHKARVNQRLIKEVKTLDGMAFHEMDENKADK